MSDLRNRRLSQVLKHRCPVQLEWAAPAADDDYFKTVTALDVHSDDVSVTEFSQGDLTASYGYAVGMCPVPVATIAENSTDTWTSVTVEFAGLDQWGDGLVESVSATNSTGTWTATSSHAWREIKKVTVTVAGDPDGSNDTVKIGYTKRYGYLVEGVNSSNFIVRDFNDLADSGTFYPNSVYEIEGTPDGTKKMKMVIVPKF